MNLDEMLQKRMAAKKQASLDDMLNKRMESKPQDGPLRPMGVGLRNVIEGASEVVDIPTEFVAGVGNLALKGVDTGLESLTGEEFGIDQYANMGGITPLVSRGLDELGLPRARGGTEEIVGSLIKGGTGATTGVGMGRAIARGAEDVVGAIRSGLTDMPIRQTMGGLLGEAGSQGVSALTSNPIAQFLGAIVGGTASGIGSSKTIPSTTSGLRSKMSPEEAGKIIERASRGDQVARQEVARIAEADPQLIRDAQELGFDLPADVFSTDRMVKEAAGLTRSQVGSQESAAFQQTVEDSVRRADEVLEELGASRDISSVDENVRNRFNDIINKGEMKIGPLYDRVDEFIPKNSDVSLDNTRAAMEQMLADVKGDIRSLTSAEREVYNRLKNVNFTYEGLKRLKGQIAQSAYGKGDLKDLDTGTAKLLARTLREDQLNAARAVGGEQAERLLRSANKVNGKIERVREKAKELFGSEFQRSIATPLRTSVGKAAKGDIGNLRKMLNALPKDLRKEALLSAISAEVRSRGGATKGDFGMSEFSNFMKGLNNNKTVKQNMSLELGGETMKTLDSLGRIADAVTTARANVIQTGKANQYMLNKLTPDNLVEKFAYPVARGATYVGLGGGVLGDVGGNLMGVVSKTPKEKLAKVNALFDDPKFVKMIEDAAAGREVSTSSVASSPAFISWARVSGVKNPRAWLNNFIMQTTEPVRDEE